MSGIELPPYAELAVYPKTVEVWVKGTVWARDKGKDRESVIWCYRENDKWVISVWKYYETNRGWWREHSTHPPETPPEDIASLAAMLFLMGEAEYEFA